jgi:hypothetical protein
LEKGTDFLERKSLRMSRIEATLSGEAKTVMATKSRTRPRNSIDWEGQTTLEGFTGTPRRRRASRRNDMSRKQILFIWSEDKKIVAIYHAINLLSTVSLDKIGKGIPDEQ